MRTSTAAAAAVVLAAGSGTRVGAAGNKVFLPIGGRPMVTWSLGACAATPGVGPLLLVVRAADREQAAAALAADPALRRVEVVLGGATRQASELAALRHLEARIRAGAVGLVLLHDGARPLVSTELVAAVLATAQRDGGAVPGLPALDLGLAGADPGPGGADPGLGGPAPDGLVAVQTPQGFRAAPLLAAYLEAERCGFAGTDTASCVQRFAPELPVRAIPGDERNIKITYPHDLMIAERLLARTGPIRH